MELDNVPGELSVTFPLVQRSAARVFSWPPNLHCIIYQQAVRMIVGRHLPVARVAVLGVQGKRAGR